MDHGVRSLWWPTFAVALTFSLPLAAQQGKVGEVGEMLASIRKKHDVPALGVAVIVDGKLAALGVDGIRRHGHPEKVTPDDLWHLGSCTKAMTATLLASQVEAGEVSWSTTVAEGLPDLAPKMHDDAKSITVQELLQHRAGLPGGPPDDLWRKLFKYEGSDEQARTEVASVLLAQAPETKPGERFLYSNAGYMIAGAIAERIGRRSWADLMRERLFAPLGITSAGFGAPGKADATEQPWGHHPKKSQTDEPESAFADNPPSLGPAGTVHMNLRDWAKFAALHLGMPPENGEPLLKSGTLVALRTKPANGEYALGWNVTKRGWAPGPILTHAGSNTMWYCVAWLAPEAKFAILVTCNQGDAGKACDDVAGACVSRFAPKK